MRVHGRFDWQNEWGRVAFRRLGQCCHTYLVMCDNTQSAVGDGRKYSPSQSMVDDVCKSEQKNSLRTHHCIERMHLVYSPCIRSHSTRHSTVLYHHSLHGCATSTGTATTTGTHACGAQLVSTWGCFSTSIPNTFRA